MKSTQFTFAVITFCIAIVSGTKAAQAVSLTTIAEGFDNARGLTYGPDGNFYLGETGTGGDGNCQSSPSTAFQPICAGDTGAIAKITPDGQTENVVSNFDSLALQPTGYEGAGSQDLKFDSNGNAYFISGFAGNPANRDAELNSLSANVQFPPEQTMAAPPLPPDQLLNTSDLGKFYKIDLSTGNYTELADLSKAELVNNPDQGDVISNPFDLEISGDQAYIADGGANVVWNVNLDGSNLSATPIPRQTIENPVFPTPEPGTGIPPAGQAEGQPTAAAGQGGQTEPPALSLPPGQSLDRVEIQSATTGVTVGPDGAIYVSEYSGFPFPEGKARIFRIGADGKPEVYADGFTQVTDIKFDKNGNLLVLQFADQSQWKGSDEAALPGSLIKLSRDGTRTTLVAAGEGLESATGLEVGPDGQIYVVNKGVGPGNGQVVRLDGLNGAAAGGNSEAVPEPTSVLGILAFGALGGAARMRRKLKQVTDEATNC